MTFRVGDIVKCVDNEGYSWLLTLGKQYKVLDLSKKCQLSPISPLEFKERYNRSNGILIEILDDDGDIVNVFSARFILVSQKILNRKLLK